MTAGIPWLPWSDEAAAELRAGGAPFLAFRRSPEGRARDWVATVRWSERFSAWFYHPHGGVLQTTPTAWARLEPPAEPEGMPT